MASLAKMWKELREPAEVLLETLREALNPRLEDLGVYVSLGRPRDIEGEGWLGYHLWLMRRKRKVANIYLIISPDPYWPKEVDVTLDIVSLKRKVPLYSQIATGTTDWMLARTLRKWNEEYIKDLFAPQIETALRRHLKKAPQDWLPLEE